MSTPRTTTTGVVSDSAGIYCANARFPIALHNEIVPLLDVTVRLARARSNHGRRKNLALVRHLARCLLEKCATVYEVKRKVPSRTGRLRPWDKRARLLSVGWTSDDMQATTVAWALERAAKLGVKPRYIGTELWLPRWLYLDATVAQLLRMKKDARYRKAKLAEQMIVKAVP